ncbi:MAG: response regulator [Gammaproteobacteria bacterium]|nr:response regulator [Gammaproteobacteria bacterium]
MSNDEPFYLKDNFFDLFLESTGAIVGFFILLTLLTAMRHESLRSKSGYRQIIAGFGLILFSLIIDITDNFPELNFLIIVGDTPVEAFLEKVLGGVLGLLLVAFGFRRWLPSILELDETRKSLAVLNQDLDNQVKKRTIDLQQINEQLQAQVAERINAESSLRKFNEELELRVVQRTAEIIAANDAKSHFLAMMSHEIRTPMNGVLGMAELLSHTDLNEEQQQYIRTIRRSGDTLNIVINDILDYSKIEAGKLVLDIVPFSFDDFLAEIVTPYKQDSKSEIAFQVWVDPELPKYLRGDTVRLHQVLTNFLSNAFKFTSKGSVNLKVQALACDGRRVQIQFCVSDTGEGISQESQQQLFKPFIQADQSITRKFGGTGLGLSICKLLVEEMDGSISVESQLSKGASFKFTVSLEVENKEDITQLRSKPVDNYSHLKLLIVDDNQVNLLVGEKLLSKLGVYVEAAISGTQALELICEQEVGFDLILMDCEMPVIDGYSATRKIRHWEEDNGRMALNIYACTAHAFPENTIKCREAGMNDILHKPLSIASLRQALEKVSVTH